MVNVMDDKSFDRMTRLFSSMESRRSTLRAVLHTVLNASLLGQFSSALAAAGKARGAGKRGNGLTLGIIRTQAVCEKDYDCINLFNATCQDGTCQCPAGQSVCDRECADLDTVCGECADLDKEPYHCGRCGNRCPSGTCVNGQCQTPESCDPFSTPEHDPDCVPGESCPVPVDKVCQANERVCPTGTVDCDEHDDCEACGLCDNKCLNPQGGAAGFCCSDGRCSCGDECCGSDDACFVEPWGPDEATPVGASMREFCCLKEKDGHICHQGKYMPLLCCLKEWSCDECIEKSKSEFEPNFCCHQKPGKG
jgi:hypothetical protein